MLLNISMYNVLLAGGTGGEEEELRDLNPKPAHNASRLASVGSRSNTSMQFFSLSTRLIKTNDKSAFLLRRFVRWCTVLGKHCCNIHLRCFLTQTETHTGWEGVGVGRRAERGWRCYRIRWACCSHRQAEENASHDRPAVNTCESRQARSTTEMRTEKK